MIPRLWLRVPLRILTACLWPSCFSLGVTHGIHNRSVSVLLYTVFYWHAPGTVCVFAGVEALAQSSKTATSVH